MKTGNARPSWIRLHPCAAALALAGVAAPGGVASAQTFTGLGFLPGDSFSEARGVSADGSVVVGASVFSTFSSDAFRWTSAGGMVNIAAPPTGLFSGASGVSADGGVVVGSIGKELTWDAFRWTAGGGLSLLQPPPAWHRALAFGTSADGSVVVGSGEPSGGSRAFRWTSGAGMVNLGTLPGDQTSWAWAVSADGAVVVGTSGNCSITCGVFCCDRAFRWTSAGGMVAIGPGAAYAASSDGSVIVGHDDAGGGSSGFKAFRWTGAGGMVSLGTLPGHTGSWAYGVSADGAAVVGTSQGPGGSVNLAFLWTPGLGMVDLNTHLPTLGINLPAGWVLTKADAISADGRAIAGIGIHNFLPEAWVAHLPEACYPDCNGSGGLTVADFTCFQTRFVAGDPYADCNQSGTLTVADFTCFQNGFILGCP